MPLHPRHLPPFGGAFEEVGIPSAGMDTDIVPRLLPVNKAPLLKNFLMDRPGTLPMRGPLCEGTAWNPGASIGLLGAWTMDDKVLVSRFAASASATRDYWVAPYRRTTSTAALRYAINPSKLVDLGAGTATDVAGTTLPRPGLKAVRAGSLLYGLAFITDASGNERYFASGGFQYPLMGIVSFDGAAYVSHSLGPICSQDVALHYNRLFVLGGASPDAAGYARTVPIQPNSLFWTDPLPTDGSSLPNVSGAWQDDVSGLTNQIMIGGASNDFGVALAHVGPNLLILKRRSLWMLYGTSPSNFVVKQVSNEIGCIDPRSVVEYDNGVYFMSERGFMSYDGSRLQNVSQGLGSTLGSNALKQVGPAGVDGGYCRATLLDRGYILVTTGVLDGATLTTTADSDAWLLHAPSGAWQQLSSGALSALIAGGRTMNYSWLMTDTKLIKASYLFNPEAAPAGTRGFDSIDSGATKFLIPSRWTTRALGLSTPPNKSQLAQIIAEYYWNLASGGWQITATCRGDQGVVNPSGTLGAPASIPSSLPARGRVELFNETDEVYMDIQATGAPATFDKAELHRILLEIRATHRVKASL